MILRRYPWLKTAAVIILVMAVIGLSAVNRRFVDQTSAASDFLPFWSAARVWFTEGLSPYDREVQQDAELMVYGRDARPELGERSFVFLYPYPALYFALPLGLFSYPLARSLWMTLLEVALPFVALLSFHVHSRKTPASLIALTMVTALLWFPGFITIINGQIAVLIVLVLVGALLTIRREADVWAGILLSLATVKPQLSAVLLLFLTIWAIRRRRWVLLLAFTAGIGALWGGALLFESEWLLLWARSIVRAVNLGLDTTPALQQLASLLPALEGPLGIALLILVAGSLVWEWGLLLLSDDRLLAWTTAYTATMSLLLIPPLQYGDQTILLLPLAVTVFYAYDRWKARAVPYSIALLAIIAGVSWLPFFLRTDATTPGRLSLLVAIILLVGLRWSRWWARHALDWWDGESHV